MWQKRYPAAQPTVHMFDSDLHEAKQPPAEHVHRQRQFLDDLNEANLPYLLGHFVYLLPTSSRFELKEHCHLDLSAVAHGFYW